jgi:hypothetical protein
MRFVDGLESGKNKQKYENKIVKEENLNDSVVDRNIEGYKETKKLVEVEKYHSLSELIDYLENRFVNVGEDAENELLYNVKSKLSCNLRKTITEMLVDAYPSRFCGVNKIYFETYIYNVVILFVFFSRFHMGVKHLHCLHLVLIRK